MKRNVLLVFVICFMTTIASASSNPLNVNPVKANLEKINLKLTEFVKKKDFKFNSKFYYAWEVETDTGISKGVSFTLELAEKTMKMVSKEEFIIGYYLIKKKKI